MTSRAIRDPVADHLITPAGLERVVQAGAQPVGWVSLACELQRDWARVETVPAGRDRAHRPPAVGMAGRS